MDTQIKTTAISDYYACPYEPDTGPVPCGEKPECAGCRWLALARSES